MDVLQWARLTHNKKRIFAGIHLGWFLAFPVASFAAPATFVTALPVAKNQVVARFNAQPLFGPNGYTSVQFPVNIGYGLTPAWSFFSTINQGFNTLDHNATTGGPGDLLLYMRYTAFKVDRPKSTFRIAPLAGFFAPTGDNRQVSGTVLAPGALQTGSGTVNPYVGIATGRSTERYGYNADTTWRYDRVASTGYSPGSQLRADAQVEVTPVPWHFPNEGVPLLFTVSLEANYTQNGDGHQNGVSSRTASKTFSQDAVLEMTRLRWQAGVGVQFPEVQSYSAPPTAKEHVGAFFYFEYYLSTPDWLHGRKR